MSASRNKHCRMEKRSSHVAHNHGIPGSNPGPATRHPGGRRGVAGLLSHVVTVLGVPLPLGGIVAPGACEAAVHHAEPAKCGVLLLSGHLQRLAAHGAWIRVPAGLGGRSLELGNPALQLGHAARQFAERPPLRNLVEEFENV